MREVLEYLEPSIPQKWLDRCLMLARQITKNLGKTREDEVNLAVIKKFQKENRLDPVVSELLLHTVQVRFQKNHDRALDKLSHRKFEACEKFLSKIKGSRTLPQTNGSVLRKRQEEFLSFTWEGEMDDDRLHDLRIRTKKFRYSYEIYDRLHNRNLGHFLRQIKFLQDILGTIHDLFVLQEMIRNEKQSWTDPDLTQIPEALQKAFDSIAAEKTKLYAQVYPRYSRVVEKLVAMNQQVHPELAHVG
jgi:CHAD domain-containing protein